MPTTQAIDERAAQMTGDEQAAYLTERGWRFIWVGWLPPHEAADVLAPGVTRTPSGMYSLSGAVREQLAREDPDAVPDEHGRYYHPGERTAP